MTDETRARLRELRDQWDRSFNDVVKNLYRWELEKADPIAEIDVLTAKVARLRADAGALAVRWLRLAKDEARAGAQQSSDNERLGRAQSALTFAQCHDELKSLLGQFDLAVERPNGDCTLRVRCYACGHRLSHAANVCPQCGTVFDGRKDPTPFPHTCCCSRCRRTTREASHDH